MQIKHRRVVFAGPAVEREREVGADPADDRRPAAVEIAVRYLRRRARPPPGSRPCSPRGPFTATSSPRTSSASAPAGARRQPALDQRSCRRLRRHPRVRMLMSTPSCIEQPARSRGADREGGVDEEGGDARAFAWLAAEPQAARAAARRPRSASCSTHGRDDRFAPQRSAYAGRSPGDRDTGSASSPRSPMPGRQRIAAGGMARRRPGKRRNSAGIATRASIRASGAPRQ